MATRATRFGLLSFDRDAIVRAALRGYVEDNVATLRHSLATRSIEGVWEGNLQRGLLGNGNGCGDNEVIAWTEEGVVGLAYELGWGPVEQLGMTYETVTGSVEDVRGAVPGLPEELEPAFLMAATRMHTRGDYDNGKWYTERLAGVGFWLHGDRLGGILFEERKYITTFGDNRLAAWGLLQGGRLPLARSSNRVELLPPDPPRMVPIQAIIDAVTDRALQGPTEFTPDELATLCPEPPEPKRLAYAQYILNKVGITWPGSPELPAEEPPHPG